MIRTFPKGISAWWNAINLVQDWIRVAESISYDDNHYTTGTSRISYWFILYNKQSTCAPWSFPPNHKNLHLTLHFLHIFIYIYIYIYISSIIDIEHYLIILQNLALHWLNKWLSDNHKTWTYIYIYIYIYIYKYRLISIMVRVIANGLGDRGSNPGRVIQKLKNGTWCFLA